MKICGIFALLNNKQKFVILKFGTGFAYIST